MVHKVPTAEIKCEPTIRGGFLENPAQVDMAGVQKMRHLNVTVIPALVTLVTRAGSFWEARRAGH